VGERRRLRVSLPTLAAFANRAGWVPATVVGTDNPGLVKGRKWIGRTALTPGPGTDTSYSHPLIDGGLAC